MTYQYVETIRTPNTATKQSQIFDKKKITTEIIPVNKTLQITKITNH